MKLRPYQETGCSFLLENGRAILADAMGVGKTPQLIAAARGKTLVVAPPALHANWHNEVSAWHEHIQADSMQIASYHGLVDRDVKDGHGHVAGVIQPEFRQEWDTLIFDECHHLKGRNTGYAKAGVKLAAQSERLYLATGTPVRNWAHELFMLLRALYPGDSRFSSYWAWADKWFTVSNKERFGKGGRKFTDKVVGDLRNITTWEVFVRENGLDERWLRRELDDKEVGLHIPEMNRIKIAARMGKHQANVYNSMEKSFFAEWDGKTEISTTTGSQWANLMRFSSGIGFHPEFEDQANTGSAKMALLTELTRDVKLPLLIFCWYRRSTELLASWFEKQGMHARPVHGGMPMKQRNGTMDSFRQGELDVLIGTYKSIGEGHNLTQAEVVILFETSPVPGDIDQALGRIRRSGQKEITTAYTLVTEGTVDEFFVDHVLPSKRSHSEGVISAADIRNYLEGKA